MRKVQISERTFMRILTVIGYIVIPLAWLVSPIVNWYMRKKSTQEKVAVYFKERRKFVDSLKKAKGIKD